jgi:hypothetical protein
VGRQYRNKETIFAFLSAYPRPTVKEAVVEWSREYASQKVERRPKRLWIELPEGETTEGREWMEHNGTVFVINPELKDEHVRKLAEESVQRKRIMTEYHEQRRAENEAENKDKQDLVPTVTMLKCPVCDGKITREPICRGCSLGRMGFVYRYICQNDSNHIMYSMNKAGLDRELEEEMSKQSA